ncbi:squamosa promoter-binding-like protein 14 [Cornus florida]|uniref:squamosa promoter-binding-like protein 14 n=1 Tax=Cornus florida TaxID=4283 RepID=UPI00289E4771|nr:squamosa promoter-binding-like protein 14 [Cornus florida]
MEEVRTQVAPQIFIHQTLAGHFCEGHPMAKKRSLPYFQQQQEQQQRFTTGFQNPREGWNPKAWDWDSTRFVAKPLESEVLRLGTVTSIQAEQQQGKRDEVSGVVPMMLKKKSVNEDDERLRLKLGSGGGSGGGGVGVDSIEGHVSRPSKRVRSGSPGGSTYPMCQVDNCKEDLSNAKDYHRRHKVCEVHSKSSKALVGKQMQRFCQQCSRFHPLSEFDEGKRSCRRRLAGHNRRRRKTQPEDATSRLLLPGNHENTNNGNLDIVNLLAVLARAQGNNGDKSGNCSAVPNKDQLIQILSKINSLPLPADFIEKLRKSGSFNRRIPEQMSSGNGNRVNEEASSQSTMDLLAALSGTLKTSAPDALAIFSQRISQSSEADKTKLASLDQSKGLNLQKGPTLEFPATGGERSSTSYQSPTEDSDCQVQETQVNLPLQLFSSSPENDSPPEFASTSKYFSSDSSNPMEERSPSSSPPVVQTLFPMKTSRENERSEKMSLSREVNANIGARNRGCNMPLDLFGGLNKGGNNNSFQSSPYQAGYTSSSRSDHSPSSLNSYAQDRTGRIIFKLFDKDPSQLPGTLRTQIYKWLSHSPSEMESYIRPGCVVLSIYVSMSSAAWEQLEENLLQRVNCLVQDSESEFWRSGRFLVHTGRQLASHKNGKIRVCKSWRSWTSPKLISVSPLAVVGGQVTSLLLRGRNLSTAGTKIRCTHMGGYISKEAPVRACQGTVYDEISLGSFEIHGTASNVLGRCFIEVENGFKGTCFPVIIADASICYELRLLESEFDASKVHDTISEEPPVDFGWPRSREEVLHFLNELGWLFQRKRISSTLEVPDYKLTRFKFLFIFSVERNCCALVKTLLDILLERDFGGNGPSVESLEMLSEIHLLNRAVKRRCRKMVDLLIHYSVLNSNEISRKYIFPPNLVGPGGITPLHLAACMSSSDDLVDTLTSDPEKIGLHCWSSLHDANGLSPYAYASMRNNHSYNTLVAQKLADTENGQVSVSIVNEIVRQCSASDQDRRPSSQIKQGQKSCSKCAVVAAKYNRRIRSSQGLLHRPYIHSMLAIAAVCVCVCLFLRGSPDIGKVAPFKWENLGYGPI